MFGIRAAATLLCMCSMTVAARIDPIGPPARSDPSRTSDKYETVRISRPDGTVISMRVPRGSSLTQRNRHTSIAVRQTSQAAKAGRGDASTPDRPVFGATRGGKGRVATPRASSERAVFTPRPPTGRVALQPANSGVRISHPYTGTRQLSPAAGRLILPDTPGRSVGVAPAAVASDTASEWQVGRGWGPGGEDDDTGDYIGADPEALIPLIAGKEFTEDTPVPPPQGNEAEPGYDAEVIARWDVVPYQTISGDFTVGILAFHMNGIDRVEISIEGGPWASLDTMQVNPRTGVREYVALIRGDDAMLATDEEIELRAIAYPAGAGTPRLLTPLFLYVNNQGSLTGPQLFVAKSGNDITGDGTENNPFATIQKALNICNSDIPLYEAATIIITEAGRYDIDSPAQRVENDRWITIQPHTSLERDEVVIAAGSTTDLMRPKTRRLRFHRISLDFSDMYQMYKEDNDQQWYDTARWYQSLGWEYSPPGSVAPVRNTDFSGVYVTDSLAEDILYAFVRCNYVRGCHAERISGDVYQNSLMVVQSTANNVDGTVLTHHTDILQYFGHHENIIAYNVNSSLTADTQNIFLDHANSSFTNCAFVNIAVQNTQSDPPFSQLNSTQDHVLFYHISNPDQRFVLRDDMAGSGKFIAKNVIFRNCVLERLQAADYFGPIPEGVSIDHCHFNYDEPRGENPTTGSIFILNSYGGEFGYVGEGASMIVGTGTVIPGYSSTTTPSRGAVPWVQPR
ncbi:MAG: hypothetical protein Q9O74_00910 [Planctomycetota bacterium]|nr:hypothetical protein [Planctomycetota bacterium]